MIEDTVSQIPAAQVCAEHLGDIMNDAETLELEAIIAPRASSKPYKQQQPFSSHALNTNPADDIAVSNALHTLNDTARSGTTKSMSVNGLKDMAVLFASGENDGEHQQGTSNAHALASADYFSGPDHRNALEGEAWAEVAPLVSEIKPKIKHPLELVTHHATILLPRDEFTPSLDNSDSNWEPLRISSIPLIHSSIEGGAANAEPMNGISIHAQTHEQVSEQQIPTKSTPLADDADKSPGSISTLHSNVTTRAQDANAESWDFDEVYQISLEKSEFGFGVILKEDNTNLIVEEFVELPNGDKGPAELTKAIAIGDYLLEVNKNSLARGSVVELRELLKRVAAGSVAELKFGRNYQAEQQFQSTGTRSFPFTAATLFAGGAKNTVALLSATSHKFGEDFGRVKSTIASTLASSVSFEKKVPAACTTQGVSTLHHDDTATGSAEYNPSCDMATVSHEQDEFIAHGSHAKDCNIQTDGHHSQELVSPINLSKLVEDQPAGSSKNNSGTSQSSQKSGKAHLAQWITRWQTRGHPAAQQDGSVEDGEFEHDSEEKPSQKERRSELNNNEIDTAKASGVNAAQTDQPNDSSPSFTDGAMEQQEELDGELEEKSGVDIKTDKNAHKDESSNNLDSYDYEVQVEKTKEGFGILFSGDGDQTCYVKDFVSFSDGSSSHARNAGVMPGDILMSVDEIQVHGLPLSVVVTCLHALPCSVVTMKFRRKKTTLRIAFQQRFMHGFSLLGTNRGGSAGVFHEGPLGAPCGSKPSSGHRILLEWEKECKALLEEVGKDRRRCAKNGEVSATELGELTHGGFSPLEIVCKIYSASSESEQQELHRKYPSLIAAVHDATNRHTTKRSKQGEWKLASLGVSEVVRVRRRSAQILETDLPATGDEVIIEPSECLSNLILAAAERFMWDGDAVDILLKHLSKCGIRTAVAFEKSLSNNTLLKKLRSSRVPFLNQSTLKWIAHTSRRNMNASAGSAHNRELQRSLTDGFGSSRDLGHPQQRAAHAF